MPVHQFGVIELSLQSAATYNNPDCDCQVTADFMAPSGKTVSVRAFWDGGPVWRIRFSPDEIGRWTWQTRCANENDSGLARKGEIQATPYEGQNPLYKHGPIKVSQDGYTLAHADGTPFFWLGDTAWNGVIRGDDNNWKKYLTLRAQQRFSVIQYVSSHWRGDPLDEAGEPACNDQSPIKINPAFFQRIDKRIAMINQAGLLAAPVVLWSLLDTDIGNSLPEQDAARLASYIVARYDAYQLAWFLGGDGRYLKNGVDRWKRIGRTVFSSGHRRIVTLHPCGQSWVGEEFRKEPWYQFIGYQSGHGDSLEHIQWLVQGPPATHWSNHPPLPVINLEPNYESAHGYQHKTIFNEYHVRRAAYWSLLLSPTAGITYGHDAIWNWNFTTAPSEGHGNWHDSAVPPWHTGLETPGIQCMSVLRNILDRLDWHTLKPAPNLLAAQPGNENPEKFIAAARTDNDTLVIYSPCGQPASLEPKASIPTPIHIVDPNTGEAVKILDSLQNPIEFPDTKDWLAIAGTEYRKK